jgi:hypothetical protein
MFRSRLFCLTSAIALIVSCAAHAQEQDHAKHQPAGAAGDARIAVIFPKTLRTHTLANMRDHLLALQEIQDALASSKFDRAAAIAEERLGMTSLKLHGAQEVAKYMPDGMQRIGTEMHHAASRFSVEATNAGVSGDLKPALGALASVTRQCVACHSSYRVQ